MAPAVPRSSLSIDKSDGHSVCSCNEAMMPGKPSDLTVDKSAATAVSRHSSEIGVFALRVSSATALCEPSASGSCTAAVMKGAATVVGNSGKRKIVMMTALTRGVSSVTVTDSHVSTRALHGSSAAVAASITRSGADHPAKLRGVSLDDEFEVLDKSDVVLMRDDVALSVLCASD